VGKILISCGNTVHVCAQNFSHKIPHARSVAISLDTHNSPPVSLPSRTQSQLQLAELSTSPQQSSQQQLSKIILILKNQKLLPALDACVKATRYLARINELN
jgi:hypothetical protein